jgi:hypothetical protein
MCLNVTARRCEAGSHMLSRVVTVSGSYAQLLVRLAVRTTVPLLRVLRSGQLRPPVTHALARALALLRGTHSSTGFLLWKDRISYIPFRVLGSCHSICSVWGVGRATYPGSDLAVPSAQA